jgi:uncharacterized protein
MEREAALALVKEHLPNPNLVKHCLAVEACMAALARRFGQEEAGWALAGLLHDLDYAYTVQTPEQHTLKTAEMLRPCGVPAEIIHAIQAHNRRVEIVSKMDAALWAVDPATGFITACALMHPEKRLAPLDLAFLKKRFKEKSFAKGASREQMADCVNLNLELDDFLLVCLQAMQEASAALGL